MASYDLLIKPSAVKEIEEIGKKKDRQKVVQRIQDLANNPRPPGCEKLSQQNRYRVRQGWFRIIYSVDDREKRVLVVKVGHRRDIYR
ncbi:MAG: type II toxin-antitoxin system RelE/ParE family toxin [Spirochaetota bacterium]|nr:MAG: type II toxin-antitoxin system RelE/ParE family toxin [Spirochaetota bacterium]